MRVDLDEIRAGLQNRLEDLLQHLQIPYRISGRWFDAKNLVRGDKNYGSFKIYRLGDERGGWCDYAAGSRGSVIDLIAYIRSRGVIDRKTRAEALKEARCFLGYEKWTPEQKNVIRQQAQHNQQVEKRRADEKAKRRLEQARKIFLDARAPITGTPVETYLRTRGIILTDVCNPERGELRFHPSLSWWMGHQYDTSGRKLQSGESYPAMVAALRDENGAFTGVHCTFLKPDGSGKAPVSPAKLMLGSMQGSAVRLTRGAGGLDEKTASLGGVDDLLVIAEGIETALSVAVAVPHARVWAAASLGNVGNQPVHRGCVHTVLIAADNDDGKEQPQKVLDAAVHKLRQSGKPVGVWKPPAGIKDFNDFLQTPTP